MVDFLNNFLLLLNFLLLNHHHNLLSFNQDLSLEFIEPNYLKSFKDLPGFTFHNLPLQVVITKLVIGP